MKRLNFNTNFLVKIKSGQVNSFYRINDEDGLAIDDSIELVDDVAKEAIGVARINQVLVKKLAALTNDEIRELSELGHDHDHKDPSDDDQIKIVTFDFLAYKTPKKLNQAISVDTMKMFSDGGSRGNPGPSASGYVLMTEDDEIIVKKGVYLGITTNNQAEYKSLLFGLEEALSLGASTIYVFMDSLLVINQMKGLFKVKHPDLLPIYRAVIETTKKFKKITFTHVPREFNKLADKEVNDCLDSN